MTEVSAGLGTGRASVGAVLDFAWAAGEFTATDVMASTSLTRSTAIDAIVVVSTMAASPGAVIQLLDAFADRPVVVWAAHLGRAVDADLSYSGITERGGTVGTPMIGAHLTRIGRPYDIVARHGGEELVVLSPSTSVDEALALAERLREAIAALAVATESGVRLTPTASIGVATYDRSQQSLAALLDDADRAMYVAKRGGKNRVALAPPRGAAPTAG